MKIAPLSHVECAVLHNHYAPIDGEKLFAFVQAEVRKVGFSNVCTRLDAGEENVHLLAGDYHILVSQNQTALDAEGFRGCLEQPITKIAMPDAHDRVERHKANTYVTIGRGLPLSMIEGESGKGEPDMLTNWAEAESAMRTCYAIARFIIAHNPSTAVHWMPSDNFVTPEYLETIAQGHTMIPLYIRPYLFSSANQLGEGLPVGLVANGSQYVLGRPVMFREAIVDLDWMIQRTCNFMDMCLLRGSVIAHGETFGIDDHERIEVLHVAPEPEAPLGRYELVVRDAKQFGIGSGDIQPVRKGRFGERAVNDDVRQYGNLDPEDPIDMAIIAALEQRNGQVGPETALPQRGDRRVQQRDHHPNSPTQFGKPAVAFGKRH